MVPRPLFPAPSRRRSGLRQPHGDARTDRPRRICTFERSIEPVLALAMPAGDDYLTRARRSVVMFAARGQCSHFVRELEVDGAVAITDTDGKAVREEGCPSCKQGVLILRSGPYGKFRSCSNFPACSYKPKGHRRRSRNVLI
jgi:hypothetical protein